MARRLEGSQLQQGIKQIFDSVYKLLESKVRPGV